MSSFFRKDAELGIFGKRFVKGPLGEIDAELSIQESEKNT